MLHIPDAEQAIVVGLGVSYRHVSVRTSGAKLRRTVVGISRVEVKIMVVMCKTS